MENEKTYWSGNFVFNLKLWWWISTKYQDCPNHLHGFWRQQKTMIKSNFSKIELRGNDLKLVWNGVYTVAFYNFKFILQMTTSRNTVP